MRFTCLVSTVCFCWAVLLLSTPTNAKGETRQAPKTARRAVHEALARVSQRRALTRETRASLAELPTEDLILELDHAIRSDGGIENEEARTLAYSLLLDWKRDAVKTGIGYKLIVDGLDDPLVSSSCAGALLRASEDKQAQVVEHLRRYLQTAKRPSGTQSGVQSGVERVLRDIPRKAQNGLAYVSILDATLQDQERHVEVRKAAAWAIAQIKPLEEALKHFQDLDPVGTDAAVRASAGCILERLDEVSKERRPYSEFYEENREDIQAVRQLVLKALQSPRAKTQAAAFEPMAVVYNQDLVVIRSREDYEVNPELRPILEEIAENHPDSGFRANVKEFLRPENVDRMVVMILHERQRQAKRNDE